MLSRDRKPARARAPGRRFRLAVGFGALGSLLASAVWAQEAPTPPEHPTFEERIEVMPTIYSAIAVDRSGRVIEDLGPEDVEASVDGQPIPVLAVDWLPSTAPERLPRFESGDEELATVAPIREEPEPRVVLFFVQSAFEASRTIGHRRTRPKLDRLIDALGPSDSAAVISFDKRPRLRLDSSLDREALRQALDRSTLGFATPESDGDPARAEHDSSLFDRLEMPTYARLFHVEDALAGAGSALAGLPGRPLLIYIGWGLGRLDNSGLHFSPRLRRASRILAEARVPVFVLDVTDADAHSLDMGLQEVAEQTGGAFYRTHLFPETAIERVSEVLGGRHRLVLDSRALRQARRTAPEAEPRIELRRKGKLLALRADL